ncbi:MAG: Swt1 family HEPN domain-containing protein [bacterium]
MAITNFERVGRALELLKEGLTPFVAREMKAYYGENWEATAVESFNIEADKALPVRWDVQKLLVVMWERWNAVFARVLGHAERSLVSELREVRNKWAHQGPFTTDDAYRMLDSVSRLLTAVSAPEAGEIERQKLELLRLRFSEQARGESRKLASASLEGKPAVGLRPWREIITPHPDVSSGRYQQAEFAADLWQVYTGEGTEEYRDPTEFFHRTYLTEGLRQLLVGAIRRLAGRGGDPVVELQTNFGGGKTHSLLALYHLFSGASVAGLAGAEGLAAEAECLVTREVKRVVLVGTKIPPGAVQRKADGTEVRTLWGELAWQLGGAEGYRMVAEADRTSTNPGDALRELFNRYAPCLILIDEWVAYARQLHNNGSLPGGSFDTQFTFAQTLSEAAKAAKQTLLVVSIPASQNEIGGQFGQDALVRLKNAVGRVESSWRPASSDEGFEIVRRRLFQPITDNALFVQRDAVIRAFSDCYAGQSGDFPPECRERSYERRMETAYPIHPELFDRLYNDWSTLDLFQRTRGVLRLMAAVIHALWESQDTNLLILPASLPIADSRVQFELTRYLEDQWPPVIAKDVDGENSLPLSLDRENANLGRYSACRRVARTIYLGSAPVQQAANRGIDERQVKLGCVQPGESVSTFGDALRRLTDRATYLYQDGQRYWYSTQPTVARLAEDRAAQMHETDVQAEIERLLRAEAASRGEFARVHACASSADVPDEPETRLVILGTEKPHIVRDLSDQDPAIGEAKDILEKRGMLPRIYRNALVFLAADRGRLGELQQAVRQQLAWDSILRDKDSLNLDPFQLRQAETKLAGAAETVKVRLPETYIWLLVPTQKNPMDPLDWNEIRLSGQDRLAVRACRKLCLEEHLIVNMGGVRLRMVLDKIPLWRGDHVLLKQLREDFFKYTYLPRLKDTATLTASVASGISQLTWADETFAFAEGYDPEKKRYRGLKAGQAASVYIDSESLIVKPEIAWAQIETERQARAEPSGVVGGVDSGDASPTGEGGAAGTTTGVAKESGSQAPIPGTMRRFHATAPLDPVRLNREIADVSESVVQHLLKEPDAEVEIFIEIRAKLPKGASDSLQRTVSENCRTLHFDQHGFEEE